MALPANIRVNVKAPFPALVYGTGPITVMKTNGIWTIGFSIASFPVQTPPLTNYAADFVFVWDSVAQAFFQMPIGVFVGLAGVQLQRSITGAGNLPIQAGDRILNINAVTDLAPSVPLAASRAGVPLTFVNIKNSHSQTITAAGTDKLGGQPTILLPSSAISDVSLTIFPFNDGVNNALGYWIA